MYYPDRWYLGDIDVEDNWFFLSGGESSLDAGKTLDIELGQEGEAMDYTTTDTYGIPIVSEAFAACLSDYRDEFQLFPVSVPEVGSPYFILWVKSNLDCVDETRSIFRKFMEDDPVRPDRAGDYKAIDQLKLDVTKIDKNIFRIAGYEVEILLSESVKEKLESADLKGLRFTLI